MARNLWRAQVIDERLVRSADQCGKGRQKRACLRSRRAGDIGRAFMSTTISWPQVTLAHPGRRQILLGAGALSLRCTLARRAPGRGRGSPPPGRVLKAERRPGEAAMS
jgi:hypothetical protein